MRKIVRATVATVAAALMAPVVAYAEPMVLTATQMDSITAAAQPLVININVAFTTQINHASAFALAIGPGARAFASVTQSNASTTRQIAGR